MRASDPTARAVCVMLLAVAVACIRAPVDVRTEATPGVDFTRIESFAQVPPPWEHPQVGSRIEEEIPRALLAKGLVQTALENADVAVSYRATGVRRTRNRRVADPDVSYTVRENYIEGTVEIDVFDARTREVVWRGVGTIDVIKDPSAPAAAAKAVREILAQFPAGS